MEAVPISFFNVTSDAQQKPTVCWTKYNGPKHVLVNTTNNCMAEVVEWANDKGSIRSQYCVTAEDELKQDENLWVSEQCSTKPILTKKIIQDRETNGMHRIYCYLYNITIGEETRPCPDFVFELPGRTTYKIANMEHFGAYVERTIFKEADIEMDKTILKRLKSEFVPMEVKNISRTNTLLESYTNSINLLPQKLNLVKSSQLLSSPVSFFANILDTIVNWLKNTRANCRSRYWAPRSRTTYAFYRITS